LFSWVGDLDLQESYPEILLLLFKFLTLKQLNKMKKIILLAAFGAAGLVSAKSFHNVGDNNKKEGKEPQKEQQVVIRQCGVQITYWEGGQVVGSQLVTSEQPDLASCQAWQNGVKFALSIAGYWVV
jgi:hypothetical protein